MSTVYPPTPSFSMLNGDNNAGRRKAKRPVNNGSKELNQQENEMLFSLLSPECVSLTAAVVQLLVAEGGAWKLILTGVSSLVKDYHERAYFLRIYDILEEKQLWTFKLYKNFRVKGFEKCQNLIAFDSSESAGGVVYGLNFSSVNEANDFKMHLDRRHAQERKGNTNGQFGGG